MSKPEIAAPPSPHVSLADLAVAFFLVGLQGFGGVAPFARAMVVDRRQWLTAAEYNEVVSLCQILPGPNTVNVAVFIGRRFQNARGAFVSVVSMMAGPVVLILILAALYSSFRDVPWVARAVSAVSAAAAGLVLGTAIKMAMALPRTMLSPGLVAVPFFAVGILHWPLVPVFLTLAVIGVLLARRLTP